MRQRLGFLVVAAMVLILGPARTMAAVPAPQTSAEKGAITGLAVSPALQQFVLSPNQANFNFSVELYNYTDQPLSLQLSVADFTTLNQAGGLAFLGNQATRLQKSHELSSFLKIDAKTITLAANTAQHVPITISATSALASGGHYAAVLARATAPGGNAGNRVSINQVVSSLVFVETAGQGTKTIKALPPSISKLRFSLPSSINLFFEATGNTQAVPRGIISIDRRLYAASPTERGIVNVDSSLLLPGSTRLLTTPLQGNQHPWRPGIYHVDLQYRYDGSLGISSYQMSFLYLNPIIIIVIIITLMIVIGLLLWLRRRRKRKISKR